MVEETEARRDEVQDHTVTQEMRFGPRQPALELQSAMRRMWSHKLVPGASVCREVTRGMLAQLLSWWWPSLSV